MANSVDPDQMPHSVASDLGLHCLQRPICPNKGYYGIDICLNSPQKHMVLINPSPAELDMSCLCKQCRSRSVGFFRSQLIWICFVCH